MKLLSLELSGFKSFGKKAILKFNTPITSIVGPNGSGKSNVTEAFRFVLGEQSLKSLRSKRGEDLIFNGAGNLAKQNRASAKLIFDNSDRMLDLDFDQVALERVVFRDGINSYLINGSEVRLKDIFELLAKANIGSSGHHIISQGEADKILNSSPKERRTVLEDALGLRIFQYKKNESQRKLEKTKQNMNQVESLRKEIAPHLRFLKKQIEKYERTKDLKEKLREIYRQYLPAEKLYIENQSKKGSKDLSNLESKKNELQSELQKIRQAGSISKENEELIRLERKFSEISFEKNNFSVSLARVQGEISTLRKIIEKNSQKENEPISKKLVQMALDDILKLEVEMNSTDSLEKLKNLLVEARKIVENLLVSSEFSDHHSLVEEISLLEIEEKKIVSKVKEIFDQEEELKRQIGLIKEEVEKNEKMNSREERIILIMTEISDLNDKISSVKNQEIQFRNEKEAYENEVREAMALLGEEIKIILSDKKDEEINSDEIKDFRENQAVLKKELEKMKIRVEEFGGTIDSEVIKEYEDTNQRDLFLEKELVDLKVSSQSLEQMIIELEKTITEKFKEGIKKVNTEFSKFFALMFDGGEAKIEVIKIQKTEKRGELDELDVIPEEENEDQEGVDVYVNLPKKKIKGLMMLSGGERALTSIALLFAISQVNPPPFVVLDETDAALDEANSRKYGDMIENLSESSQLILVTHNRETMSRAGIIYGVTMISGSSELLSIQFEDAVKVAK